MDFLISMLNEVTLKHKIDVEGGGIIGKIESNRGWGNFRNF